MIRKIKRKEVANMYELVIVDEHYFESLQIEEIKKHTYIKNATDPTCVTASAEDKDYPIFDWIDHYAKSTRDFWKPLFGQLVFVRRDSFIPIVIKFTECEKEVDSFEELESYQPGAKGNDRN